MKKHSFAVDCSCTLTCPHTHGSAHACTPTTGARTNTRANARTFAQTHTITRIHSHTRTNAPTRAPFIFFLGLGLFDYRLNVGFKVQSKPTRVQGWVKMAFCLLCDATLPSSLYFDIYK